MCSGIKSHIKIESIQILEIDTNYLRMDFEQNDTSVELSDVELQALMATLQSSWPVRTTHRDLNEQLPPEFPCIAPLTAPLLRPSLVRTGICEAQERVLMGAEDDVRADELPPARPALVRTITGMCNELPPAPLLVRTEMCDEFPAHIVETYVEPLPVFTYEQLHPDQRERYWEEESTCDTPVFPGLPGPLPITAEEVEEIMQGLRSRISSV